jgi:hypothetical protein
MIASMARMPGMRLGQPLAIFAIGALALALPDRAVAEQTLPKGDDAIELLREIHQAGPRFIGSPGHQRAAEILQARLASLPGVVVASDEEVNYSPDQPRLILHDLKQVVPDTEFARMTLADGREIELFPFWPNGARLPTTPPEGVTGELIYVGVGEEKEIPAKSLSGAIVAMEYNSFDRWIELVQFGPKAFLFLAPEDTSWTHSHGKFADLTFNCPRFYVDDKKIAAEIRSRTHHDAVKVVSRMRWAEKTARSFVLILPGPSEEREVVMANARYDACSVVPQLAYGAEQAISAAVLYEAAKYLIERPRKRTMVMMWAGADSINFVSTRAIMHASRRAPHRWGTRAYWKKDSLVNEEREKHTEKLASLDNQESLVRKDLKSAIENDTDVRKQYEHRVKQHLVPIAKELTALRGRRKQLKDQNVVPAERDAIEREIAEWETEQEKYDLLMIDIQRSRVLTENLPVFKELTAEVTAQIGAERAESEYELKGLNRDITHIRPWLDRDDVVAFFAPDISSHGQRFGIYWQTRWRNDNNFVMLSTLAQRLLGRKEEDRFPDEVYEGYLDDTMQGRRDWEADICCPLATSADPVQHFAYLCLAMVTADDGRWVVDSPLDLPERVNTANIKRQVPGVCAILDRSVSREKLRQRFIHRYTRVHQIDGQAVVLSPGDARLDLGQSGRLAIVNTFRPVPRGVGTRWLYAQLTSATGHYKFPYVSRSWATGADYWVDVFGLDDDGRIVEAANHVTTPDPYKFKEIVSLVAGMAEGIKSVMFDCDEQYIAGLRDPRYLHDLKFLRPLNQRTGDDPHYTATRATNGLGCVFLEPDRKWVLAASRGQRGVRMILTNASNERPLGEGFDFSNPILSAFWRTLNDFDILNESRLTDLRESGVVGSLADDLKDRSREAMKEAEAAHDRDEAGEALYHARTAFGLHQMLYNHLQGTGHDTVIAVVFLLMVLLPFSFYSERLFMNSATIYGRIGGFVAVFLVMMGLLISFHPAFRLALTPVVVLLAFIIIVLSGVVTLILYSRFSEQLKQGLASEHSTSLSRLNVISQAMLVGISNMRRRKIRTAFTLVTLVVMTFTLLSLSGTQTELTERRFGVDVAPSYPGVMITHVGWREMPGAFLEEIEASYGDQATVGGQYWMMPNETRWMRNFPWHVVVRRNDGSNDSHLLSALMGIGPNETSFLELDSETEALFQKLTDHPNGCLLPSDVSKTLGVRVGDDVRLHGRIFQIVGLFDAQRLDDCKYLSGRPYGPIDLSSEKQIEEAWGGWYHKEVDFTEEMLEPSLVRSDLNLNPLDPRLYGLINYQAAREMGGSLRSICIRTDTTEMLDHIANDLSTQRLMPIYRSTEDEVQLVATRTKLGIVGIRDLLIPLLIGALIVMNTMINAVADQRSTIHIYTSLGLAPVHVGMLFLSEAAALGTLGVVGGFILGQGFGTAAKAFGWFDALTLNYSSTAVMLTMFLVMLIVLLSAIYPARMAGRLAAPAEARRWELPAPRGDRIEMELPFTVSETTAWGAPAFLRQWVALHSESGVGVFVSDRSRVFHDTESDHRVLEATLWLAPFDVGVSQDIRLEIFPTEEGGTAGRESKFYEVSIQMIRRSGQEVDWRRSNRAFIGELRKQFLLWRTLTLERQQTYVEESQKMLAEE